MKSDHCPATGAIQELYRCSIKLIEAASSRRGCIEPSRLPFASSFMRRIIVTPTGDVEASSLCIEASSLYIEEHRGASSLYVEASRPGLWAGGAVAVASGPCSLVSAAAGGAGALPGSGVVRGKRRRPPALHRAAAQSPRSRRSRGRLGGPGGAAARGAP